MLVAKEVGFLNGVPNRHMSNVCFSNFPGPNKFSIPLRPQSREDAGFSKVTMIPFWMQARINRKHNLARYMPVSAPSDAAGFATENDVQGGAKCTHHTRLA